MAKFRSSAKTLRDPFEKIYPWLLPVVLFLAVTAISHQFAVGLAAVALILSLGKAPRTALQSRFSLLTLAVVLYAAVYLASGLWCNFGDYAASESLKMLIALTVFGLVLSRTKQEKVTGLLWALNGVIAVIALLCVDAGSCQILSRGFCTLMELLRSGYDVATMGYEAGIRITGIYSNANVSGGVIAFGLILSLYLHQTAECEKGRMAALYMAGLEAVSFFFAFSMGAMGAFAVTCLVYVACAGKGKRLPLFLLMLECVAVTVVLAMVSASSLGTGSPLPLLMALVCGAIIWALERFVGSRVSAALAERGRAVGIAGGVLAVVVAAYVVLAFTITGGTTLNGTEKLSRAVYPAPGEYTVSVEGAIDPNVRIYTQNEAQLMMHKETTLYKGALSEASFAVPEDSKVVWFVLSGDGDVDAITLSDGTKVPLGYKLLPSFAANRLQGLRANQNFIQRLVFFQDGLKLWKESPVLGWGVGGVEGQLTAVQSFYYESKYIHNQPIQIMAEAGIVGLASFLLLLGSAIWMLLRRRKEEDPIIPMLAAALTMMTMHSLTEVVWSTQVYLVVVFALLAVVIIRCTGGEKKSGAAGVAVMAALWAVVLVFAVLQACSLTAAKINRDLQEQNPSRTEFVVGLKKADALEFYNDSAYQANAMVNALQVEGGFATATGLAKELMATKEFNNCYYVAAYYCLPTRNFDSFFLAVQTGLAQEASNPDAWNSMARLCIQAAKQLDAEELEEFLPGVANFRAELEAFNNSGRMEQIVMEEKNQIFLDNAVMLVESGASGEMAQLMLSPLLQ